MAGQEIERVEVEARPPTTDLIATLKASLGRNELAKAARANSALEPAAVKRPARLPSVVAETRDDSSSGIVQPVEELKMWCAQNHSISDRVTPV